MISYKPLLYTLVSLDKSISDLQKENGGPLNKKTVKKLKDHDSVNLTTIETVCIFLDVPIEKVVEIINE